ncbi:MAG TPA: phage/plasmid primase, P4 family [Pirellulales bacterium]|jgi:putative DNA primase/helicase|nr:phage/plasmid primase, P4 family [Pirellulales bacterium]
MFLDSIGAFLKQHQPLNHMRRLWATDIGTQINFVGHDPRRIPSDGAGKRGDPYFHDTTYHPPLTTETVEAIGVNGWNYVDQISWFWDFDLDSVCGHANGLSADQLAEIVDKLKVVPEVELTRSKSGKGFHVRIYGANPPLARTHNEHQRNGHRALQWLAAQTGLDLQANFDCCGVMSWIWHRDAAQNGFELLKPAECELAELPESLPTDEVAQTTAQDQQFQSSDLSAEHRKLIEYLQSRGRGEWDDDRKCLKTHTASLQQAHADLKLKGKFKTVATGKEGPSDRNCFAYARENGAWFVTRYHKDVKEADTWKKSKRGWTCCYFNKPALRKGKLNDPHRLADSYLRRHAINGLPTFRRLNDTSYSWSNGMWEETDQKRISPLLTESIKSDFDACAEKFGKPPRAVKRSLVGDTYNALESIARIHVDPHLAPPFWLTHHDWPATDCLPCNNLLIHLPGLLTGNVEYSIPISSALFNNHKLPIHFDSGAPEPKRWLRFLSEVWDDSDCHALLQEWFGYCLTRDTLLQKFLMLLGIGRSGKGTITRILSALVGHSMAGPSLKSLGTRFGLDPLWGKSLALVPDAKFPKDKDDVQEIVSVLKAVTGEDAVLIDGKNIRQFTGRLPIKIVISSNDTRLALPDDSGALYDRALCLRFTRQFKGKDADPKLGQQLEAELPGILNWAIDGLRRLRINQGQFTEPKSSRELKAVLRHAAAPVSEFIEEHCNLSDRAAIPCQALYEIYRQQCEAEELEAVNARQFGKALANGFPMVERKRSADGFTVCSKFSTDAQRPWYYLGLTLKHPC